MYAYINVCIFVLVYNMCVFSSIPTSFLLSWHFSENMIDCSTTTFNINEMLTKGKKHNGGNNLKKGNI